MITREQIIKQIAEYRNVAVESLSDNTDLYEELGLDSLSYLEMVVKLEMLLDRDLDCVMNPKGIQTIGDLLQKIMV